MKQACQLTGLSYETLKFYCNQGLVPNVQRDSLNRRVFSQNNVDWINSLGCLKNCGMSIQEMKDYLTLCLEGLSTIPQRKEILDAKRRELEEKQKAIQDSIAYIDWKKHYYDECLAGNQAYIRKLTGEE